MKETRIHKTKNRAPKIDEMPLPPEVAGLPVIKAEPWFLIHPDVKEGMLEDRRSIGRTIYIFVLEDLLAISAKYLGSRRRRKSLRSLIHLPQCLLV